MIRNFADHGEAVEERRASLTEAEAKKSSEDVAAQEIKHAAAAKVHADAVAAKKIAAQRQNAHVDEVRVRHELDAALEDSARHRELAEHERQEELAAALRADQINAKIERIRDLE